MELRSGRSRSNTPLLSSSFEKSTITSNHIEKTSRRSTTIKTYENVSTGSRKLKSSRSRKGMHTSDYSSEDEHDISTSGEHISDNLKNQLREEALYSNGKGNVSALKVYKEAGEYWNKFPKTDYTYSRHSKDRVELAPGVVAMPNMSRRSLHTYTSPETGYSLNKQTNTETYLASDSIDYITSNNGAEVRQRFISSNSNQYDDQEEEEEEEEREDEYFIRRRSVEKVTIIQRILHVLIRIFTTIFYPVYFVYNKQNSLIIWFARKLHKIASQFMLLDTWLLQGSTVFDRKISTIVGLCLFPLIFFGGWWLLCGLNQLFQGIFNGNTVSSILPTQTSNILTIPSWMKESLVDQNSQEDHIDHTDLINELNIKINRMQEELNIVESKKKGKGIDNKLIDDLNAKIEAIQKVLINSEQSRKDDIAKILREIQLKLEVDKEEFMSEINRNNKQVLIQTEQYIFKYLKEILGAPDHVINTQDFSKWFHFIFVTRQYLNERLQNLTLTLNNNFKIILSDNENLIMDKVMANILELNLQTKSDGTIPMINFSDEHIKKLIGEALAVYDADKTGLVDFALESSGGHVISTRCTESYQAKTATLSIFGIPIYYPTKSPRTAITPGTSPGECWAFQSFPGFLVVKLSARIIVGGFSLEHISRRLSATDKIDSALKKFEVFGLNEENDPEPTLLGKYEYRDDGKPLQYFQVQNKGQIFDLVELRIYSNHGNPNYTCLYRFRVHGTLSQEPT